MASALKNLSHYDDTKLPNAKELKFGIVVSDYHHNITHKLYEGCLETLLEHGAEEANIEVMQVPGTFELVAGARILAGRHNSDAVICIGCVIRGETSHNDYINSAVAQGLATLSAMAGKAFIFGVLTPDTEAQAQDRAGGKHGNKGVEAAVAALRMAALKKKKGQAKQKIGFGM